MQSLIWVGIDVGKVSHHACATDSDGTIVFSAKVGNTQFAIEELVARAGTAAAQVRWAIDLTSSSATLLIAVLTHADQHVVYVPGRVVHQMSTVFRGESKTDAKDALVIAQTARMRNDLSRVSPADDVVVELAQATAHRQDLVADWVRGINRLRDLLTSVFPGLERILDCSKRSALILLTGFQTPEALRAASTADVIAHLRAGNARSVPSLAASAIAVAAEQTIQLPGETTNAVLIARHAARLLDLDREIKAVTKLIAERFHQHPDAAIIESLPGLGPILGGEFIVATGGNLDGFASAGHLASYAGLVPVPKDSGRITGTSDGLNATTAGSGACSSWPPSAASRPEASPKRSTTANVLNTGSTSKPSSPLPAASSTSSGHCCATEGPSPPPALRQPPLDSIIQIPSRLDDRVVANTIIAGQQGTYHHLPDRVCQLLADSGQSARGSM